MQLSRTARFLIAALLIAAAAFVWVNFFNQSQLEGGSTLAASPPEGGAINVGETAGDGTVTDPAATDAAGSPAAVNGQPTALVGNEQDGVAAQPGGTQTGQQPAGVAQPGSTQAGAPGGDAGGVTPSGPAVTDQSAPPSIDVGAPAVVIEGSEQVVTRDLVVEQLPFLVLSAPTSATTEDGSTPAGASRPQASQRASINPFSPVVVQAPPAAPQQQVAQATAEAPASPAIVEVQNDGRQPSTASGSSSGSGVQASAPSAPAEPIRAPAPRTVAPAGTVASELPRALPSGTLPSTPQILRDARSQPAVAEPSVPALGDLAALREPGSEEATDFTPVDVQPGAAVADVPDPLGPGRPLSQPVATEPRANTLPLAVGADPLSRYLRDNDVRFTGTVLGPLSVGVFRSDMYSAPVILTLGQTLPDTDILLSDLRGYEARFTQGDRTQTLSLDLRR